MSTDLSLEELLAEARQLLRARKLEDAARLLERHPDSADALFLLGAVRAEAKDFARAVQALDRAFAMSPDQSAGNHLLFAYALCDAGDFARAESMARRALSLQPGWGRGFAALAAALHGQGRAAEALEALRAAAKADPDAAGAHRNLGSMLHEAGRADEALEPLRRAASLAPRDAALRFFVGRIEEHLGHVADAAESYRVVASLDRGHAQALWRLARLLHRQARLTEAIEGYREALMLDEDNAEAWNDLGNALTDAGQLDDARTAYRRTLALRPGYHQVESNLLINLHYDPTVGREALYEAHRDWARRHASGLGSVEPAPRKGGDKLRVGLLSPAFTPGPTAAFLAPLLRHLDRGRFELFAYNVGSSAGVDAAIPAAMASWQDASGDDDAALAQRMAHDGLDVLLDLAGHAPGGRLRTLAMKPAPVIVAWLDYFNTTGLDQVDYLVGDPVSTPPGGGQPFAEKLLLLEPCRFCYAPPAYAPPVMPAPATRNGFVTFGSFNRLSKLAPPVLALWARVLNAVPRSRLLAKNAAFADAGTRERFAGMLGALGVERSRVELRAASPHERMLEEYGDVDLALDAFPYNGGLTTCEALWMGVPVVAFEGDAMISRQSASMLRAAGLEDFVAPDADALVPLAARLANGIDALAALRLTMRERIGSSPLLDAPRFASAFARLLERAAIVDR